MSTSRINALSPKSLEYRLVVRQPRPPYDATSAEMPASEAGKWYGELEEDLHHLVRKYCRIMGWEVPELDEQEARKLILEAIHHALAKVEAA